MKLWKIFVDECELDQVDAMVIVAPDRKTAREMAQDYLSNVRYTGQDIRDFTIHELDPETDSGVIVASYNAG